MEEKVRYNAPWGMSVAIATGVTTLFFVGMPLIGLSIGPRGNILWILVMIVVPLSIIIAASLFSIRGYVLTGDRLIVRRLGWNSEVDLSG